MQKIYYDTDADLTALKGKTISVIGYGIQGRAQALNLRDSGCAVQIGNRSDSYVSPAEKDGFKVLPIPQAAEVADILLLLIPDQAHREVYEEQIRPFLRPGGSLVVAHGYSLRYGALTPRDDLDVMLLAPRMPGRQIRDYYLRGSGVPAFADVVRDRSGSAWKTLLSLAKGMGFTRTGVLQVSIEQETENDLFVEQFLIPTILKSIEVGFEEMVKAGYDPVPALLELYASGELGEVLLRAAKVGLFKTFQENASPTCQFGIARSYPEALEKDPRRFAREVIERIRSDRFSQALESEGKRDYPETARLWARTEESQLTRTHEEILKLFKNA